MGGPICMPWAAPCSSCWWAERRGRRRLAEHAFCFGEELLRAKYFLVRARVEPAARFALRRNRLLCALLVVGPRAHRIRRQLRGDLLRGMLAELEGRGDRVLASLTPDGS